jgi:hypothetical protein
MPDTIPDTADKGIREFLAAVGFTLVLIGGEMMAEKDGLRFWTGTILVLAAIPFYLSGALWNAVRPHLNKYALASLDAISNRAPWWLRGFFIVFLALIISQIIGQVRWPFPAPAPTLSENNLPNKYI